MKTISAIAIAALSMAASAQAASISVPNFEIYPRGTNTVNVNISPDASGMFAYKGFQFDLSTLPAGITINWESNTAMNGFSKEGETFSNGTSRILSFTENSAVTTTDNILSIKFSASQSTQPGTYSVNVSNVIFSSPQGMDILGQNSQFTITVLEAPAEPEIPETPIPNGWYGNYNGTYVSALKIREGNSLGMGVNMPTGGFENSWSFVWEDPASAVIGNQREIWTEAKLYGDAVNAGNNQAISENDYLVTVTNYDPQNNEYWIDGLSTATVEVYKRPQTPAQLLRKGQHPEGGQTPETGTSHTFVVMMTPLSNEQVSSLGYSYTFGYTDASGVMHTLETTSRRYTHTTDEIYWNSSYTFWAYSQWTYADGSVITSGLRYLDGTADEGFDASTFSGETRGETPGASGIGAVEAEGEITGIYSFDGRYVGTDPGALSHGMYIIRYANSVKKVIL